MNNKIFSIVSSLIIIGFSALNACIAIAQCTPNAAFTAPGFYPDPLPSPTAGLPYSQVIDFKLPSTFDTLGFTATIDSLTFDSITNLPTGLSYQCNQTDCKYLGGQNGCMLLQGTPSITSGGPYTITIYGTGYISLLGTSFPIQQTQSIDLFVNWPQSIQENIVNLDRKWMITSNEINEVAFHSISMGQYDVSVFGLNGALLNSSSFKSLGGESIDLNSITGELSKQTAIIYTLSLNGSIVESRILVRK
jgi:hypothetical protein